MYRVRKTVPIIFGILILAGSLGFQYTPFTVQTVEAESSKRIIGYFPYWESGDINSIDYTKLTDIIYFHIWPNPDGSLDTSAVNINDLNEIRNNAHSAGVNVLIAVGGWGVSNGFPVMADDDNARANFVANIADYIIANDLDGVDIDWETTIDQTKIDNQDILLSDLSNTLQPLGKLVTVAANGELSELKSSAAGSVDWVNVMAYDMNWGNAEHSTFLDSAASLQMYEDEGIPKEKLSLGIPFYGRDDNTNAIKYEDVVSACNPLPSENTCNGYFFNGIDLVKEKSQFVLNNSYGGVMIWNLGQDTYEDNTSLLKAINDVFNDSTPLPNNPPIADTQSVTTTEDTPIAIILSASDADGDSLAYSVIEIPSSGTISGTEPNLTYTPNTGFTGNDSFTFRASDGTSGSNFATVSIIVNQTLEVNVEQFEVTTSGNKRWTGYVTTVVFNEGVPIENANILGSWSTGESISCTTDVTGACQVLEQTKQDTLTFTVDRINGNGLSYNPNSPDSITFDKNGNIQGDNKSPTADVGGPYSGIEGVLIAFDGTLSDDSDGSITSYDWDFGDGSFGTGETTSHTFATSGTYSVTLTVIDDDGATDIDSSIVNISPSSSSDLTIANLSPTSMTRGVQTHMVITGTGFDDTTTITFSGAKWAPKVVNLQFNDSTQIEIDVTRSTAGPGRAFVYDVTATNQNGDSVTLEQGFTVIGQ